MSATLRRATVSLGIPNYRRYFAGQVISISGNWMQIVAEMWLVVQLTGSGVSVGLTAGLQFLPILLLGAMGGVLADRYDKRRLLMVTQWCMAVPAVALWAITATPDGRALLAAARTRKDAFLSERLDALSAEDRATLERAAALLEGLLE